VLVVDMDPVHRNDASQKEVPPSMVVVVVVVVGMGQGTADLQTEVATLAVVRSVIDQHP